MNLVFKNDFKKEQIHNNDHLPLFLRMYNSTYVTRHCPRVDEMNFNEKMYEISLKIIRRCSTHICMLFLDLTNEGPGVWALQVSEKGLGNGRHNGNYRKLSHAKMFLVVCFLLLFFLSPFFSFFI